MKKTELTKILELKLQTSPFDIIWDTIHKMNGSWAMSNIPPEVYQEKFQRLAKIMEEIIIPQRESAVYHGLVLYLESEYKRIYGNEKIWK